MTAITEYMTDLRVRFESALEDEFEQWSCWPPRLQEACRYALSTGGKRIRPILALMSADAVGTSMDRAMP